MSAELLLGLICAVSVGLRIAFWVRGWYVSRMCEAYDLGHKLGRASVQMGQAAVDALLRESGIDPTQLPPRR